MRNPSTPKEIELGQIQEKKKIPKQCSESGSFKTFMFIWEKKESILLCNLTVGQQKQKKIKEKPRSFALHPRIPNFARSTDSCWAVLFLSAHRQRHLRRRRVRYLHILRIWTCGAVSGENHRNEGKIAAGSVSSFQFVCILSWSPRCFCPNCARPRARVVHERNRLLICLWFFFGGVLF